MNYANVFGRTQKQFDMTMNREKSQLPNFVKVENRFGKITKTRNGLTPNLGKSKTD